MSETPYQNIDISQNNPLGFKNEEGLNPPNNLKKPLNPKIIILIVLATIILVLFIVSLVVSPQSGENTPGTLQNTPTPSGETVPTVSKSLVPQIYQDKFTLIEKNLNNDLDVEIPVFDLEVGL